MSVINAVNSSGSMINLLQAPFSREGLIDVFKKNPPRCALPTFDSGQWKVLMDRPVTARYRTLLVDRALDEADTPLPVLTDDLYQAFARSGQRIGFENTYFERRRRLARAAVALLASDGEPESRVLQSFLDKLEDVSGEESWAFPAHVSNPTGRDPKVIDLFAAETANLMGECLSVFGVLIPSALRERILTRLRENIFRLYLETDYGWMQNTNNWNAVCHQGVLGAALTIEDDAGILADLLLRARRYLPRYLDGFGSDGACSEGPTYWNYGFGWFTVLEEQLQVRSGGALSLFHDNPLVASIAGYGPAMTLNDGHVVSFADSNPRLRLRPSVLQYLGERLNHPECLKLARKLYRGLLTGEADLDFQRADLFYWLRFFLYEPDLSGEETDGEKLRSDHYYPSLGVWLASGYDRRGNRWEIAAKAGSNDEHHNHNDVGNFILRINDTGIVCDLGMPEYTRDYFSPKRYECLAARMLGHSLPLINGQEQACGAEYAGAVLSQRLDQDAVDVEMELAQAYPAAAHCRRFVRRLSLDKKSGVVLCTDSLTLSEPGGIESGFIFILSGLEIASPRCLRLRVESGVIEMECDPRSRWDRIETHHYQSHEGEPATCYRAVLVPAVQGAGALFELSVAIRIIS
jgi:hypothetical protein